MKMIHIEVLEIKPLLNGGNLRAFVKLQIGETIFHDFRIIQQPGQRAWVSAPQAMWIDKDSHTRYKTLIEFPHRLKSIISEAVLSAWQQQQQEAA